MTHYLFEKIQTFFKDIRQIQGARASEMLEWEIQEMENIFALLVLGTFVGIPSPPVHVMSELMPDMEQEFAIMLDKVSVAHDPLGELFSMLDIH